MASTSKETVLYNVYILKLSQCRGMHQGIILVPAQEEPQNAGRFYNVKGDLGLGMDYEYIESYKFFCSKSYKTKEYKSQLPKTHLKAFESIAEACELPKDSRSLYSIPIPKEEVKDCTTWVAEVIGKVRDLLQKDDLPV